MVGRPWTPDAGDVIWITFDLRIGHEQGGHRPAVVLSSIDYNRTIGLLICVPMTTRIKGYPFEVPIAGEAASVALADHVKSFDWRARRATPKSRVTDTELANIRRKIGHILD